MKHRYFAALLAALALASVSASVDAQGWSAEQKEVWAFEQQQWKMAAAKDNSWVETMVHPNVSYWDNDQALPRGRDSLAKWIRFESTNSTVLEQEIEPISIVITGNLAVVNYAYTIASEDTAKKRSMTTGRYMDVLLKEDGRWKFIAWSGGDDPEK